MIGLPIKPDSLRGRKNFILGIGINQYGKFNNLSSCKRDIDNFIEVAIGNYEYFDKKDVKTLFNSEATKSAILEEIRKAFLEKQGEWNVIFYFAGHGDYARSVKKGYLIPHDGQPGKRQSFISFDEITKYISNSSVHHALIICDSCSAGSMFKYFRESSDNSAIFINRCYKISSRYGLTSGREEAVHDGTLRKPSPFSEVLVDILKLNSKQSKALTLESLKAQIGDEFNRKFEEKEQMPQSHPLEIKGHNHQGGQFVFIPKREVAITFEVPQVGKPTSDKEIPVISSSTDVNKGLDDIMTINSAYPNNLPEVHSSKGLRSSKSRDDDYSEPTKEEIEKRKKRFRKFKNWVILIFIICFIIRLTVHLIEETKSKGSISNESEVTPPSGPAIGTFPPPVKTDSTKPQPSPHPQKGSKPKPAIKLSKDYTLGNNLVFVGSFENKENAVNILKTMKTIGYEKAEIIMKENLPYMVVVTGFYQYKNSAKAEVKAIKKRGFEVYYANEDSNRIYRKQ